MPERYAFGLKQYRRLPSPNSQPVVRPTPDQRTLAHTALTRGMCGRPKSQVA